MVAMSFWAHLASLLAFLGLGWWLCRLHQQRQTLAELVATPSKVKVDWPGHYLTLVAKSLGIGVEVTGKLSKGDPVKINVALLAEFFRSHRVQSISVDTKNDIIKVCVKVARIESGSDDRAELLRQAFQNRLDVRLEVIS